MPPGLFYAIWEALGWLSRVLVALIAAFFIALALGVLLAPFIPRA